MSNKIIIITLIITASALFIYFVAKDKSSEIEIVEELDKMINVEEISESNEVIKKNEDKARSFDFEETNLEAVGIYSGSAIATRSFDGKTFMHEVRAKIGDPSEGKFYEGWLVNPPSFFSTGKMIKEGDEYVVLYRTNENKISFSEVVITEETKANGLDGKPEVHVLEGLFK